MNTTTKAHIKGFIGKKPLKAYHAAQARLAHALSHDPSNGMILIGVTGTNGKTTTAHLIASIFEHAGYRTALLSTVEYRVNGASTINESKMTVPNPFALNAFLRQARSGKCQVVVLEVTSIALDQQRLFGMQFDTGVLTNITHDHLDYHGTFDAYVQAKRSFFARGLRLSICNMDDPNGVEFSTLTASLHLNYTLHTQDPDSVHITEVHSLDDQDTELICSIPNPKCSVTLRTSLIGSFNHANILAAIAVAFGHGISIEHIESGISGVVAVPGRMEWVKAGQPFAVMVDYAHTPDALQQLYQTLRPRFKGGRLIAVLGSCGDRDREKRPILGEIAGREADLVIITNEDPYTEDPQLIIDAVTCGVEAGNNAHRLGESYWKIADRRDAIHHALRMARSGDIVVVTGKGAETAMVWGSEHRPWSDHTVITEELQKLLNSHD